MMIVRSCGTFSLLAILDKKSTDEFRDGVPIMVSTGDFGLDGDKTLAISVIQSDQRFAVPPNAPTRNRTLYVLDREQVGMDPGEFIVGKDASNDGRDSWNISTMLVLNTPDPQAYIATLRAETGVPLKFVGTAPSDRPQHLN